jgi:hypothetical protein
MIPVVVDSKLFLYIDAVSSVLHIHQTKPYCFTVSIQEIVANISFELSFVFYKHSKELCCQITSA